MHTKTGTKTYTRSKITVALVSLSFVFALGIILQPWIGRIPPPKVQAPNQTLQSNFFKNDPDAQKILTTPLDISNPQIYNLPNPLFMSSMPYKFFLGLIMIGHQHENSNLVKSPDFQITLLNKFQKSNNLSLSNSIDKTTLLTLDSFIAKKENLTNGYSNKMGSIFLSEAADFLQTNLPKDYVAWIFLFPLEVLPKHLTQNLTTQNYFYCLYRQCAGSIKKADGSDFVDYVSPQTYNQGNFIFLPDVFPNNTNGDTVYFQKSTKSVQTILHEFAHYLDKSVSEPLPQYNEGFIDTISFKTISFEPEANGLFDGNGCFKRKTNNVYDFISRYGYDGANAYGCKKQGAEYGAPHEDFADSFAAYVLAGKIFRNAAQTNTYVKQKYNWLKQNVFKGIEYNTDIPFGTSYDYDGCPDTSDSVPNGGPYYLSCNTNYVWDGTIPSFINILPPIK